MSSWTRSLVSLGDVEAERSWESLAATQGWVARVTLGGRVEGAILL